MTHSQSIMVSGNLPSSSLNIVLTCGKFQLRGHTVDNNDEPIRSEIVLLKNGVIVKKTVSDERNGGSYSFNYLIEGTYEIQASALCHSPTGWIGRIGSNTTNADPNDVQKAIEVNFTLQVIEGCTIVGKCDVCLQANKVVKYCKFCHAYICDECRHNYPERVKALFRLRFSELHESASEKELELEYEKELTERPHKATPNCCSG